MAFSLSRASGGPLLAAVLLFGVSLGCSRPAEWSRVVVGRHVVDEAHLISGDNFNAQWLADRFKAFSAQRCGPGELSRLLVGTNRRDIEASLNQYPGEIGSGAVARLASDPALLGSDVERRTIAQVICFDGTITQYIRQGIQVWSNRVSGDHDAWQFTIEGLACQIVGIRVVVSEQGDRLVAYVRAAGSPDAVKVVQLRDLLKAKTGAPVTVIMRTDPFFSLFEGPACDPFEAPWPISLAQGTYERKYVACGPEDAARQCVNSSLAINESIVRSAQADKGIQGK